MKTVKLYTDGANSMKQRVGGWAFILYHPKSGKKIQKYGYEFETTNNRMELTAALKGLRLLKDRCKVDLYTDSQYVSRGITEWMENWKINGWKRVNADLWKEMYDLCQKHIVVTHWVKGHNGHEENEICDKLAVAAYTNLKKST